MDNGMDILLGKYAGSGFGLVLHWVILFFLAVTALYIVITAVSRILGFFSDAMKDTAPAAPPAPSHEEPALHAEAETAAPDTGMNERAAAIGLALHLTLLRNSVKAITVRRVYRSSWKEARRSGVMDRL